MTFRVRQRHAWAQCGEYLSLTSVQKLLIGKRTAEDGVTATEQYYSKAFPHNGSPNLPIFP